MRQRFLMTLLGLVAGLFASCANLNSETDARLDKTIETFLEAVRAQDDGAILALAADPQNFGDGGRLNAEVVGFLYDGSYIRGSSSEARSVVEIMALGPLRIHILRDEVGPTAVISAPKLAGEKARVVIVETGGRATVLIIPEQFEEQLQVVSFYSERWMRDYFACEFHLVESRWVPLYNICFALTDGPYLEPYG